MSPGSTEILNDDIKELRADIPKLDVGLAELRQGVKDAIALGKWAGTVLVAVLSTSGIGAVIWGASLTTKVYGMESRGNEKFQAVDARFDKLEASIAKILEQTKPATK
jgi:hypothetical protein